MVAMMVAMVLKSVAALVEQSVSYWAGEKVDTMVDWRVADSPLHLVAKKADRTAYQ